MSVVLTLTSVPTNTRPSVTWSGVDALNNVNTNWSDALNWQTPGVPTAAEPVSFNDAAAAPATPFDQSGGVGSGSSVDQANINNIVDVSLTNAALSYANTANSFQNTQIAPGKTLTINGSVTVNGSSGNVTILGTGAALTVNNPNHNNTFNVENGSVPMLDMSGLDTFTATVGQIGVGFDIASSGSDVNGVWYLARTNTITTGVGSFSTGTALVVGGANTQNATGTGQIYLGQTNVLYVDGILLGLGGASAGSLITFNPAFTNPVAYIRGISGNSSRVTSWSLGDNSVNLNNGAASYGHLNDFSAGTLNALVNTLTVGRGVLGNGAGAHTPNSQVMGTFNMGSGILDVTTLNIGQDGSGVEGAGIGIMNVSTNGTLLVNSLGLGVGVITNTAGTLNLTNATLVVSNGITIGTGTNGGTLDCEFSTVKILNGTIGTPGAPLTTLILDGSTLQLSVNGSSMVTNIVATNVITEATTTINIAPIANVSGTVVFPLISYVGTDPTTNNLALGTLSAGYTGSLVDDVANSSIDLSITSLVKPTPHFTSVGISGTTLTIQGINGADSGPYVLLGTTNLTLPLSQWTRLLTNNFAPNGNFNLSTNIINPALPQQFYLLLQ